jgi:hypothetical protein
MWGQTSEEHSASFYSEDGGILLLRNPGSHLPHIQQGIAAQLEGGGGATERPEI